MRKVFCMLTALIIVVFAAYPAAAWQEMPQGMMLAAQMEDDEAPGGGPQRGMPDEQREEIRQKIAAVRIYRLTEELKLDPATSGRLAALLGSLDSERVQLMREHREGMRELAALSGTGNERKMKEVMARLEKNQRRKLELREREWKGIKDILSVEQQAQYLLFHQRFMREMRGMMSGARGGRGQGMRGGDGRGMGPGAGPGPGTPPR